MTTDPWEPPSGPAAARPDGGPGWAPPPPPPPAVQPSGWDAGLPPTSWSGPPPGVNPASDWTFSVREAIGHGWTKTRANLGLVILATIAAASITAIIDRGAMALVTATIGVPDETAVGFGRAAAAGAVSSTITSTVGVLLQAGVAGGSLALVDGRPVTVDVALPVRYLPRLLVGSLLISVAAAIGLILFVVPGVVVLVLSSYFVFFTIDKDLPVRQALTASASFVGGNLWPLFRLCLASALVVFAGVLALGVGVLVAIPVVVIASAYAFRVLQGQPVST